MLFGSPKKNQVRMQSFPWCLSQFVETKPVDESFVTAQTDIIIWSQSFLIPFSFSSISLLFNTNYISFSSSFWVSAPISASYLSSNYQTWSYFCLISLSFARTVSFSFSASFESPVSTTFFSVWRVLRAFSWSSFSWFRASFSSYSKVWYLQISVWCRFSEDSSLDVNV